jgi:hypothetical protein
LPTALAGLGSGAPELAGEAAPERAQEATEGALEDRTGPPKARDDHGRSCADESPQEGSDPIGRSRSPRLAGEGHLNSGEAHDGAQAERAESQGEQDEDSLLSARCVAKPRDPGIGGRCHWGVRV